MSAPLPAVEGKQESLPHHGDRRSATGRVLGSDFDRTCAYARIGLPEHGVVRDHDRTTARGNDGSAFGRGGRGESQALHLIAFVFVDGERESIHLLEKPCTAAHLLRGNNASL